MTPERQEDGWAELRREIEALLGVALMVERDALHYEETFVQRSAVLAIVDRLATPVADTAGIDAARLRAHLTHAHSFCGQCQGFAAALRTPKPEGEPE